MFPWGAPSWLPSGRLFTQSRYNRYGPTAIEGKYLGCVVLKLIKEQNPLKQCSVVWKILLAVSYV